MDRLTGLELFVQIAEMENISRAAQAVGLSNASASRYLIALEKRLDARLVDRSTRHLRLTDIGRTFYERCRLALEDIHDAQRAASATASEAAGVLRVAGPLSFCMSEIAPLIPAFADRYPKVVVHLIADNRYRESFESGVDVVIRTRRQEADSTLTVRRLVNTARSLAASPAYLRRHGTPAKPADLASHAMLTYANAAQRELTFRRARRSVTVALRSVFEANDGQIIRAVALQGFGISIQPNYIIHDDLAAGRLVGILPEWQIAPLQISLVYPSRRHLPAKTRAFIDFVIAHFRSGDRQERWLSRVDGGARSSIPNS